MSYPLRLPFDNPLLTVTHPSPQLWVLELHNGEDSRLTDVLVNRGLKPALDAVEKDWREARRAALNGGDATDPKSTAGIGALVIVGKRGQDKFFSNGLDYANSSKDTGFFPNTFNPLMTRLLTFPIPTVAAINGHCFAAGMMLSLLCDYRVMTDGRKRRAWMCMNEIAFGAPWPLSFAATLRAKVGSAQLHRRIALEGHRFTPQEALAAGLIDYIVEDGNTEAVLAKACEVALAAAPGARSGAWGLIKRDLYGDVVKAAAKDNRAIHPAIDDYAAKARL